MSATIEIEDSYSSGVYSKRPVVIVRGRGAVVWDAEEREYIDCTAGYGVANIGHGRPEIAAALAAQASRLRPGGFDPNPAARALAGDRKRRNTAGITIGLTDHPSRLRFLYPPAILPPPPAGL